MELPASLKIDRVYDKMVVCMTSIRVCAHKDLMARKVLLRPFQANLIDRLSGELVAFLGGKALDIVLILAAATLLPDLLGKAHLAQGILPVIGTVLATCQGVLLVDIGHDMPQAGPGAYGFNNCHSRSTSSWISRVTGGA